MKTTKEREQKKLVNKAFAECFWEYLCDCTNRYWIVGLTGLVILHGSGICIALYFFNKSPEALGRAVGIAVAITFTIHIGLSSFCKKIVRHCL